MRRLRPDPPPLHRIPAATVALLAAATLLSGCGAGDPGGRDVPVEVLAVARSAHQGMLPVRSRDPEATGQPVVDAFVEETLIDDVRATFEDDGTVEVVAAFAMEEVDEDGTYGDEMLGMCVRVVATTGAADGEVGERGRVSTDEVTCPDGLTPTRYGQEAQIVTGLPSSADDVPLPVKEPGACYGTTGDCPGG